MNAQDGMRSLEVDAALDGILPDEVTDIVHHFAFVRYEVYLRAMGTRTFVPRRQSTVSAEGFASLDDSIDWQSWNTMDT
jgi:hypothetical protein